jgi:hypothetical protein
VLGLAIVFSAQTLTAEPQLSYFEGNFVIRDAGKVVRVPRTAKPANGPMSIAFRRDDHWAVWDDRGLTVRVGKMVRSSRLEEIAVSPRIFTRDEITKTLESKRDKRARFLSGAKRIGTKVYFLPRWVDSGGKTWLEALVELDLSVSNPKPKLLARLVGISPAKLGIDNYLFLIDGKLTVPVQRESDWGLASWLPEQVVWDVKPMGKSLLALTEGGILIERSNQGTFVASQVNFAANKSRSLFESRASISIVDDREPPLIRVDGNPGALFDATTARLVPFPASAGICRTADYVIAYSGKDAPTAATLFSMKTWQPIASWSAN